jgi:hypothetical protein
MTHGKNGASERLPSLSRQGAHNVTETIHGGWNTCSGRAGIGTGNTQGP